MKLNNLPNQKKNHAIANTIFLGILSMIFLNGCAWIGKRKDTITASSLPQVNNQFQITTIWSHSLGKTADSFYSNLQPAWRNACIFVANRYGVVKALDVNSGKSLWSRDLSTYTSFFLHHRSAKLSSGVTVAGDRVYVGSELAKIYAINAKNGSLEWEKIIAGEALSTPIVNNNLILEHTGNGMLQALNTVDGTIKWTINLSVPPLTIRGESAPTIALGVAIIGDDNGRVSAVTINEGQLIWQQRISQLNNETDITRINDVQANPVIVNDIVYALAYNGNLAALDLYSGRIIWLQKIGSVTNFLVQNNRIYLVDQDDRVIAVDAQNGRILWCQNKLLHRILTSPVLYDGYVVTGDSEGYLHWMSTENGTFVAQKKVDNSGLLATPIVVEKKLIVQTKNGTLYAITH